ncbi:thioredoxin family protein [Aegicerativicinus sediminis]
MRQKIYFLSLILLIVSCKKEKTNSIIESEDQATSINFIIDDLDEAISVAKSEDKFIFIDCYTTWCIPCKWMEQNVFVENNVINYYNDNFVNLKLDMEKGVGPELNKKFKVNAYPTYVFINSEGELIHKGRSTMLPEEFVQMGKDALNPSKAYGILTKKYNDGTISNKDLLELTTKAYRLGEKKYTEYYDELMGKVDETFLVSENGFNLVQSFVYNDQHELFNTLKNNDKEYRQLVGDSLVNRVYTLCILQNFSKELKTMDEETLHYNLDSLKSLDALPRSIAFNHGRYYLLREDIEKFNEISEKYIQEYFHNDGVSIAYLADMVFRMGKQNEKFKDEADRLITKAYKMKPHDLGILNSYVQIKNNLGYKKDAIEKAELAVKIADTVGQIEKDKALKTLEQLQGSI